MTFTQFIKELKDLQYELKHRIGLSLFNSKNQTGDGTLGDLIHLVVMNDLKDLFNPIVDSFKDGQEVSDADIMKFKEDYINKFMALYHELVIKHQRFNWNWP